MVLRLHIRQKKTFDLQRQEIYYSGNSPYSLQAQIGTVPPSRQFTDYPNYIDVTDFVSDLHKLTITYTQERAADGGLVPIGLQQKKASSGIITFEGDGHDLIKRWLIDDISASNNVIEVQIEHVGCGYYTDWNIGAQDIDWCDDGTCTFDVSLKQNDEALTCIKNTLIADNWQGWFPEDGKPANKMHPRFSYCTEVRSDALLVVIWAIITQNMPLFLVTGIVIGLIWNSIVAIFISILSLFAVFSQKVRDKIQELEDQFINWKDIKDIIGNFYIESAGCGREHPAPLIRDYISNVCSKCGVTVNDNTAPIFFASSIQIETSADRLTGRGAQTRWNPHYKACYLSPTVKKGVRRYDDLRLIQGANRNTTTFWLPGNQPLLYLDQLLDQLAPLYNARWEVVNNELIFKRKDDWLQGGYVFDFTSGSEDNNLLLKGNCYEWNGETYPAAITGLYGLDGADVSGNGGTKYYNGTVSVGNVLSNPNFDGTLYKNTVFSPTKFRLDGADDDYILNAWRQVNNSAFVLGSIWTPTVINSIMNDEFAEFADYAVLLKQENVTQPKILIWDESSGFLNAKAYRPFGAVNFNATTPTPNIPYNNYQGTKQWPQAYPPDTKVGGREVGQPGVYQISSPWMLSGAYRRTAWLVNYPMYFAQGFEDGMWDWFHWIDDPRFNPRLNKTVTIRMELCCETLKRLDVFGNGNKVTLGKKVKLDGMYDGYITNVEINYDTSNEDGMYIEIRVAQ